MATTLLSNVAADIENLIADDLLRLTFNKLILYQLGEQKRLPKGRGITYTKMRANRLPLPFGPLAEAVPAVASQISLSEVTVTCQQWGGLAVLSDRASYAIKHDAVKMVKDLISIQAAETLERNTINTLFAFTQINTANAVGSRFSLAAGNTLGLIDLQRAFSQLGALGAYKWDGTEDVNPKIDATGDAHAKATKLSSPHYILICHEFVAGDLGVQPGFIQASSYSDVNKLYNAEVGQWFGNRVVSSNMIPFFTGAALISGTASAAGGSLATNTYFIIVTESDPMRGYEQVLHQVSAGIAVTGPTGSISVVLPTSSLLYNIYIGTTNTPTNLAVSPAGPLTGSFQGQATQIPGGQTVTLTNIGIPATPQAPVATGVTVYPSWVIGKYAYTQVVLDDIEIHYLGDADKVDPHNQLRECSWKIDYGTLPENNMFVIRIESASQFSATFN